MKRYGQLNRAARREAALAATTTGGQTALTANAFVDYLLAKRGRYRPSSWRQVRRAAIYGMTQEAERDPAAAPAIHAAISRLEAAAPAPDENLPPRTSSNKAKRSSESDLDRMCFAALAGRLLVAQVFATHQCKNGRRLGYGRITWIEGIQHRRN
jgi:hypothetical protein